MHAHTYTQSTILIHLKETWGIFCYQSHRSCKCCFCVWPTFTTGKWIEIEIGCFFYSIFFPLPSSQVPWSGPWAWGWGKYPFASELLSYLSVIVSQKVALSKSLPASAVGFPCCGWGLHSRPWGQGTEEWCNSHQMLSVDSATTVLKSRLVMAADHLFLFICWEDSVWLVLEGGIWGGDACFVCFPIGEKALL